ncbi:GntR family transcriptional regulator [Streptomyces sp. NA02950]|uniref:GntR family transcriptional regulator n=1 Tax=Streptomyces sp. NA02950 TaxID=2742137 RepID=UPI001590DA03|nr:GntR family transcriptional regulator [Streptomyces sp. NA02950]QKV90418.1 GntR family transcriptional regulator [Streptomyces sp. NA02950]QKV97249.1 GntR family transcriptional regulator [Streptomyces sp. NA02950]
MSGEVQRQTAESSSTPSDSAGTRRALRADLLRLGRIGGARSASSSAAVIEGHALIDRHTDPWVPLAECRREAAAGSPADQARWSRLIEAVTHPPNPTDASYEKLIVRVGNARDLLRTLADTLPPFVPVADVAQRIEQRIKAGTYPPGAVLAPGRIAADLALPLQSVHLALADLADTSVIEQQANGRARVPGAHPLNDRPRQLAQHLRELAAGGAFSTGTALPDRRELCRILVTGKKPLAIALRLLLEEGLLERGTHRRLTVRRDAVKQTNPAPRRLPEPAPNLKGLHTDEIREAVRQARTWWNARLSPTPGALDQVIDQLNAAAHQLADRAQRGPLPPSTTRQELSTLIARTTITATAVHHPHYQLRIWHTACLATAVGDLLALLDVIDRFRPVGSTTTPLRRDVESALLHVRLPAVEST